jgi:hypothetical protein
MISMRLHVLHDNSAKAISNTDYLMGEYPLMVGGDYALDIDANHHHSVAK